jgi:alanine-synthesizing transaminase
MKKIKKSEHLSSVRYDIRGPIAQASQKLKLEGINVTELNIGNPGLFGFKVPDTMNMALIRNLEKSAAYCHSNGIFSAREAIVVDSQNQGVHGLDIDRVFLGNGVSELILMAMEALLNQGDEVLVPSPDYPLWSAAVKISGGTPAYYNCDSDNDWMPNLEHMESQITANTRAIVVINPNNPTGAVYTKETLEGIIDIARRHDLIVYADEIYSKVLYDDAQHIPMATLAEDILIVSFNGLSKSYRACGFRCGWLYLTGAVEKAESYIEGLNLLASMRLCSNVPAQWAVQTALGGYQSIFDLCSGEGRLNRQREISYQRLSAIPGIDVVNAKGALYLFPEIDLKVYDFKSCEDFVIRFLEEEHVLLVHGSGFNYTRATAFRVVFLPYEEDLQRAFDALERFLKRYLR